MEDEIQRNIDRLRHDDPIVRYWAVLYLEERCDKAAVPALIDTLCDQDEAVRGVAARALASFGPAAETAIPALKQTMDDAEVWVRNAAAYALSKIEAGEQDIVSAYLRFTGKRTSVRTSSGGVSAGSVKYTSSDGPTTS